MNPFPHDRVVEPMEVNGRTVLVCNCEGTMPLDGAKLAKACGASGPATLATQLCRAELDRFITALESPGTKPLMVACTQEAPLFDDQARGLRPRRPRHLRQHPRTRRLVRRGRRRPPQDRGPDRRSDAPDLPRLLDRAEVRRRRLDLRPRRAGDRSRPPAHGQAGHHRPPDPAQRGHPPAHGGVPDPQGHHRQGHRPPRQVRGRGRRLRRPPPLVAASP